MEHNHPGLDLSVLWVEAVSIPEIGPGQLKALLVEMDRAFRYHGLIGAAPHGGQGENNR
jgi:hypothetical protein